MPYCPNCHAVLKSESGACWNCKALFTGNAPKPTARPLGPFRMLPEVKETSPPPPASAPAPSKTRHPLLSILLRAVVSLVVYVPLFLFIVYLAVLGGPGDDGSALLGLGVYVLGWVLLAWVCAPLLRFFK